MGSRNREFEKLRVGRVLFDYENNTNSGDNHCIPTHFLYDLRGPRSSTKLVVGTVMNSTLAKQNEDSMTGKQNISRLALKATIHQPLLIM